MSEWNMPSHATDEPSRARWSRRFVRQILGGALVVSWLIASSVIATELFHVEPHRSNRWVVTLIFFAPVAVATVIATVVPEAVHRIKFGPAKPGRHSRGERLKADPSRKLDDGDLGRVHGDTPN